MPEFLLYKSNGAISNKKIVANAFNELEDGRYRVVISSYKKRSLPQNAYLHGCVIPMVFEGLRNVGYDDVHDHEDAKFIIKNLFLKRKIGNRETGEVMELVKQTSKLTTTEFNEFIDEVIRWAAEYLSIQIPMPNEPILMFENV